MTTHLQRQFQDSVLKNIPEKFAYKHGIVDKSEQCGNASEKRIPNDHFNVEGY